jgi:hypothetical protein
MCLREFYIEKILFWIISELKAPISSYVISTSKITTAAGFKSITSALNLSNICGEVCPLIRDWYKIFEEEFGVDIASKFGYGITHKKQFCFRGLCGI